MPINDLDPASRFWQHRIEQYIRQHPDRPLKLRPLARNLGVPDEQYAAFRAVVRHLLERGSLALGRGRALTAPGTRGELVGIFRAHPDGYGFLEVPGHVDHFVPHERTLDAREGDTVAAKALRGGAARGPRAEVVRIIARAAVRWVGVLESLGGRWIVRPRGRTAIAAVEIVDPTAKGAHPGELVVVEPVETRSADRAQPIRGVVIERLGAPSETRVRVLGVARQCLLPEAFSDEVRAAARRAADRFAQADFGQREDLRGQLCITIDPPDARDYDDAISVRRLGPGFELGVHIADVTWFVRPGDALDQEAHQRGNSVYFPTFVVPMLPEVLSNAACSLQPQQPRLAKSVFIAYDGQGRVLDTRFANSVIQSHARLAYPQAAAILAGEPTGLDAPTVRLLRLADRLARIIQRRRLGQGMLVLNLPEVEFELDEQEHVRNARPADTDFSHTLIEMFMVEANEAVSRALTRAGVTHLRRVHPPPATDQSSAYRLLRAALGDGAPRDLERGSIQRLLEQSRDRPEAPVVHLLLLRCLAQACYSTAEEGHFALASEHYCHFTSPIRRYPDLVNQRLLDAYVLQAEHAARDRAHSELPNDPQLEHIAEECSRTERRAQDAERDARQILLLEFMRGHIGEEFEALVTGVASFGVFVRIRAHLAEGLLHRDDLPPDQWVHDSATVSLRSRRSGRVVRMGDELRIRIASIDDVRQVLRVVPVGPVGHPIAEAPSGRPKREGVKRPITSGPSRKGSREEHGRRGRGRSRRNRSGR